MHYYQQRPEPKEPQPCAIAACDELVTDKYMVNLQMEWEERMETPAPYYCSLNCLRRKFLNKASAESSKD